MDQETLRGQVSEYRIYESIASGGFGSVYIGRDIATNVPVAVKRLHPHLKDEPGFVERFEQEASTVRGLEHANIVRLLDQGRDAHGVPFIVMEWVEGLTIGDWLKRRGKYAPSEAADVGCQVLEGLNAAWARRVVHRDIKPANLMVTPGGRVKIMDFGVAKDLDLATLAGSSGLIGTPAYMAPEQLRGQALDSRADLYALGVTLYMMVAGRPPFEGPSFADYFRQHLEQEPPRLETLSPDIDAGLADVLRTSLAKTPDDRFSSPSDMLAALRPYADERTRLDPPMARTPLPEQTVFTRGTPPPGAMPREASVPTVFGRATPAPSSAPAAARTYPPAAADAASDVGATVAVRPADAPAGRRIAPWMVAAPVAGVVVVAGIVLLLTLTRNNSSPSAPVIPTQESSVITTPQADGTLYKNPLASLSDTTQLKTSVSPASYSVGRATDNSFFIQKLTPDSAPPALATVPGVFTDAKLEVDATAETSAPTGVITLGCRDQAGANARYQMSLLPARKQVVINEVVSGTERPLAGPADVAGALKTDGSADHLSMVCKGATISAQINDRDVLSAQNGDYAQGGMILGAGAPGAAFEAHFKNLVISRQ